MEVDELLEDELDEDETEPEGPRALRDYFAGQAISGILANPDPNLHVSTQNADDFADMAYEVADAMIKRRESGTKTFRLWPVELRDDPEVSTG